MGHNPVCSPRSFDISILWNKAFNIVNYGTDVVVFQYALNHFRRTALSVDNTKHTAFDHFDGFSVNNNNAS